MPDKFKALWLSHSSIGDYLKCPRAYYLNNIYKNPESGRKISITNAHLSLGQVVHDVLESLSELPVEKRLEIPFKVVYEVKWRKVSGALGGFKSEAEESEFKSRGLEMLKKVESDPGPILEKAIKINMDLPWYFLSEKEEIILCGKIDWIRYNQADNTVDIIDFKTGKHDEDRDSLQLAIYRLLLENCQKREVRRASYWYLDRGELVDYELPATAKAQERVMEVALKIKEARRKQELNCPKGGCYACQDLEKVVRGEAKFVGVGSYNKEIYVIG